MQLPVVRLRFGLELVDWMRRLNKVGFPNSSSFSAAMASASRAPAVALSGRER
jgi:hypothetical protein